MTTVEVTPFEESVTAANPNPSSLGSTMATQTIGKILSPTSKLPWNGIPDSNLEPVTALEDVYDTTIAPGAMLPGTAEVTNVWAITSGTAEPTPAVLQTPGFPFLPDAGTRWSYMEMEQPTLLSSGWFRLEYIGKLGPSDPSSQKIVVTGPIPTREAMLSNKFGLSWAFYGQAGASPSFFANMFMYAKDTAEAKRFASKMRIAASSATITPDVDSIYDGGTVKQFVLGADHRLRGEGVMPRGYPGELADPTYSGPLYLWDGEEMGPMYTPATGNSPTSIITDTAELASKAKEHSVSEVKHPMTGGAYPIWRGNGEFVDADLCAVENPFAVRTVDSRLNNARAIKSGQLSATYGPTKAPVVVTTFTNLHHSCALNFKRVQLSEIVPALGSIIQSSSNKTQSIPNMGILLKQAATAAAQVNPSSANDMGTLWKKVRTWFDNNRSLIAGAASMIPEVGVPMAALVQSLPYKQSAKARNTWKDEDMDQLTSKMAKAGIQTKRVPAKPSTKKRVTVTTGKLAGKGKLRAARRK